MIVSVCPPDAARALAEEVAGHLDPARPGPLFVDANAVSPRPSGIAEVLGAERVVDGAIIGPPAWEPGRTVLWLAGPEAPAVAALFAGSPFAARVLSGPGGHGERSQGVLRAAEQGAAHPLGSRSTPPRGPTASPTRSAKSCTATASTSTPALAAWKRRRKARPGGGWGRCRRRGTRSPRSACPTGSPAPPPQIYGLMAATDPTDRANPWGLRGPGDA